MKKFRNVTTIEEEFQYESQWGLVRIVFENGVFKCVSYPFSTPYTREQWKCLSEIDAVIDGLDRIKDLYAGYNRNKQFYTNLEFPSENAAEATSA